MKPINSEWSSIYIDIDDTITPDCGKTFNPYAIRLIKELSKKTNVIIWSHGGFEYAKEIVLVSGLEPYICQALPKPSMMIDDLPPSDWASWANVKQGGWYHVEELNKELTGDWIEDNSLLQNLHYKEKNP